jgi:hypothetical protein
MQSSAQTSAEMKNSFGWGKNERNIGGGLSGALIRGRN